MVYSTPKKRVLFVRKFVPAFLAVFGVFSLLAINLHSPKLAYATASDTVNFQARLQTSGGAIVPDGTYNIEFKLYNATGSTSNPGSCSSDCVWYEDYTGANKVTVKNGYLNVQLGSQTAFPGTIDWSQQLYLTMDIGGTGSPSWDGEMLPRLALTATPYSFLSQRALTSDNADQISTTNTNGTNTLSLQGPSSGNGGQNFVLQDQGASGTYYLLAANGSGDVSVSGLASAANIATGSVDRASSGTLSIGSTHASAISLGNTSSNIATTINGTAIVKPTSGNDTTGVFQVQDANSHDLIDVDTSTETVNLGAVSAAMASTVNVATSTTTGQTVNIASGAITSGTNTVNIGTGATSSGADDVNIGSGNGASATNVQGGSGGVVLGTGSTTGDSGTITIQSGDSSSGTSGNVVIDTGSSAVNSGTYVEQDTFESGTNNWVNWFNTTVAQSSAQHHVGTGSNSLAITTAASSPPDTWGAQVDVAHAYAVTPGRAYNFSAWVYSATSETLNFSVGWGSGIQTITDATIPANTWTQLSGSLIAPTNATTAVTILGSKVAVANGIVTYLDDVMVNGGGSSPLVALGANNAASVILGNQHELGPTTLQGGAGGINLVTGGNGNIAIGNLTGTGSVALLGEGISQTITGAASNPSDVIKTTTNSTAAFQVQNASSASILNVNTASSAVIIGSTANGGLLVNDGATLNTAKAISDVSGGGSIGTKETTVDVYTTFAINQTTASQTLSLPNPTDTTAGRIVYILNVGSAAFTMSGVVIGTGTNASFLWNGSSWTATAVSTGVTLIGSVGGNGQNANGASISGNTLYMQYADDTSFSGSGAPGLVSTSTQAFKGQKTFDDLLTAGNGLTVNNAAITGNAGLNIGTGAVFLNQGATENTVLALSDFTGNAAMTTAANINAYTGFTINQTTSSISLTLPSPTVDATKMHVIYVSNIGSAAITVAGVGIGAGDFATFSWNGSAWSPAAAGVGGAYINNSTSLQAANFYVQAASNGTVAATFRANSNNDADIADFLNGAGTPVGSIGPTGITLFKPSAPSTTAFQVQPSGSTTPVFDVDTSNNRVGVNMNNPAYALDVNGAISTNTAVYVNGVSVCTSSCIPSGGSGNYIQNSTTVQTSANFYMRGVGSTSPTGVLQGANGQTGDLLDLQTWNGSSATTVAKFNSNGSLAIGASGVSSTSAFSVQDSAGDATFTADTTHQQLIAVQNSSSQTTPLVVLKQMSTGDAAIQFLNNTSANSFSLGLDTTGSDVFKISSSGASGGGSSIAGSNSQSASLDSGNLNIESASKVQASSSGAVTTLHVYLDGGTGNVQMALYSDNGGSPSHPSALLASSGTTTFSGVAGWYSFTIASTNVTSSTYYWIVFNTDNAGVNYAWANASTGSLDNDYESQTYGTWSSGWTSMGIGGSGNGYAVYMDVVGASTDEFSGALFTLSQSGQAKFQNSSDSNTAFRIQNSSSGNVLSADTQNGRVIIGTGSTGESSGKILVLDNQTGTGAEPTEVDGGMYYSVSLGGFRCGIGGIWVSCVSLNNASTADQTVTTTTPAYLNGSMITIPASGLHAGTQFTWRIALTKSASGTTAPTFVVKYGTNGTTSDTSEITFTGPTETAASDTAYVVINVTVRSVNASTGTWTGSMTMLHTDAASTGFINSTNQTFLATTTTGNFNDTTSGAKVGITVTAGASNTFTVSQVQTNAFNL